MIQTYNYDVENEYRGVDTKGNNIHKALVDIVKKARAGTETQKTALLSFDRQGDLKEEGEYYSLEYKVTSDISMQEYTITRTGTISVSSGYTLTIQGTGTSR